MHACWEQTTKKKEEGLNISASVLSRVQLNSLQPYGLQLLSHGFSAIARLLCPRDSLGKNTGVGCHFLLPVILLLSHRFPLVLVVGGESGSSPLLQ